MILFYSPRCNAGWKQGYIYTNIQGYVYTNIQGYIYTKMIGQLVGLQDIGVLYATSVSMVSTHLTQVYSAESSLLAQ